jgi:conjugative transposon TraK protein
MQALKNIETSFQMTKTLAISAILGSVIYSLVLTYFYYKNTKDVAERVYILSSGAAIEAFSSNVRENRPAEAKHHIKRLHELFFTVSPDPKSIQRNMERAYYYGDASIKKLYDAYAEKQFFNDMITANAVQEISIDSVKLNMRDYPFHVNCFASLTIKRATTTTTRSLITECSMIEVNRSDNNPHGLMVQDWRVLENKDIKTENKF